MKVVYFIFIILLENILSMQFGLEIMKSKKSRLKLSNFDDDLPDGPIFHQAWVKYLRYTIKDSEKPKQFYKNIFYEQQMRLNPSNDKMDKQDEYGHLLIPSEVNFWVMLYKDTLNLLASRDNGFGNTIDTMDFTNIKVIPEDDHRNGGIKNIGKLREGYCFKVEVLIPLEHFVPSSDNYEPRNSVDQIWIFCANSEPDKAIFMNRLIALKLRMQKEQGLLIFSKKIENQHSPTNSTTVKSKDGRWVMIQDWSNCTLKCGGGMQYKQFVCVPPENGGKPCEGDAIQSRPCNDQACPHVNFLHDNPQNEKMSDTLNPNGNTLPPIVKVMAVSKRPQRYDKCYLKESDVFMIKEDDKSASDKYKPKIPVRLVMNDKTISAYLDDNLSNRIVTYSLLETLFVRSKNYNRCFELLNNLRHSTFCELETRDLDSWIEEWDYDYNLFRNQCKRNRPLSEKLLEEQKLENQFKEKVENLKVEIVKEVAVTKKREAEESEEIVLTKQVQKTQLHSLMAIQKELELEKLLEKEETVRENQENKELDFEIVEEKKKEDCLNNAIKQKQIEVQYNLAKEHAQEEIRKIEEQTQREIETKRREIAKKIMEMRKKQERRKATKRGEIINIRAVIARKVNRLSKVGDSSQCYNKNKMNDYCDANFSDDLVKHSDCINTDTFCDICCESEFGEWHLVEREKCEKGCH